MDRRQREIAEALDRVVGDEYRPRARRGARLAKWAAAAVLAIATSAAIVAILHTHVMKAQTAPAPPAAKKPVPVMIIPAK